MNNLSNITHTPFHRPRQENVRLLVTSASQQRRKGVTSHTTGFVSAIMDRLDEICTVTSFCW